MKKLLYALFIVTVATTQLHADGPIGGLFDAVGSAVEGTGRAVGRALDRTGDALTGERHHYRHHQRHADGSMHEEHHHLKKQVDGQTVKEEETTVRTYTHDVR